jgi:ABC-2 type transport system permease protein
MTATAVSVPAVHGGGPSITASTLQTLAVMQRHLRGLLRQPAFVIITLVQPAMWLVLFGALFSNVVRIPGFAAPGSTSSYIDYLTPAVLVMTALFSSGWVGMGIIEDIDRGIMDRFLTAPVRRGALIAGHQAYAAVSLLIQAAVIGIMAFLLGAEFRGGIGGFAVLVATALLLGAAFGALSDATALVLRQRESVIGVNTMLTLPLTFLSAAFMPLALVPDWIAKVAAVNPVNWAVEAGRAGFSGTGDAGYIALRLGGLAVLAVLSMLLATRAFRSYQRSV